MYILEIKRSPIYNTLVSEQQDGRNEG